MAATRGVSGELVNEPQFAGKPFAFLTLDEARRAFLKQSHKQAIYGGR